MTEPDANGWYPIESAPASIRNGQPIDLWVANVRTEPPSGIRQAGCRWSAEEQVWGTPCGYPVIENNTYRITHWRYPPKPPVEFGEKGDV